MRLTVTSTARKPAEGAEWQERLQVDFSAPKIERLDLGCAMLSFGSKSGDTQITLFMSRAERQRLVRELSKT